jgi:transposase
MRALDPEVFDALWSAVEALIPLPASTHPLGCHRPRIPDRVCFRGIVIRLVTGCSWVDTERLLDAQVSDTTLRARRDEWIAAGVFDTLVEEALNAYDRIIGLDLGEVALDGSQHKAPTGGEGTGANCTDKGRCGWKWSLLTEGNGIPIGWVSDGANRHDSKLVAPTLDACATRGLLAEIDTLHLDRGYSYRFVLDECAARGINDIQVPRRRTRSKIRRRTNKIIPLGLRWPVERTNSWLTNYGQLRRNTDRHSRHRNAQLALAIAFLLTAKLIDWRTRWSPIR